MRKKQKKQNKNGICAFGLDLDLSVRATHIVYTHTLYTLIYICISV